MFHRAWKRQRRRAGGQRDLPRHPVVEVVALTGPPLPRALGRSAELGGDRLLGQHDDHALRLGRVVLVRAEVQRALLVGQRRPRSRASPAAASPTRRGRRPGCRCPRRSAADSRLCAMIDHQPTALSPPPPGCRTGRAGRGRGRTRGRRRCGRRSPAGSCSRRSTGRWCRSGCRRRGCSPGPGRCSGTPSSGATRWRPRPGTGHRRPGRRRRARSGSGRCSRPAR